MPSFINYHKLAAAIAGGVALANGPKDPLQTAKLVGGIIGAAVLADTLPKLLPSGKGNRRTKVAARHDEEVAKLDNKYSELGAMIRKHIVQCDNSKEEASTKALSDLYKEGFVCAADCVRDNAEKLWWIHGRMGHEVQGGMAVKLSASLNLFCGTVANLGSEAHRHVLDEIMSRGELGSFAVTEVGAGVLSGLIIETTAEWTSSGFILNTPTKAGRKVWISQGRTGAWSVVVARLILPDEADATKKKDWGPHAFLIRTVNLPGLLIEDMEAKTEFNNLDNVFMEFKDCKVPLDSMLSGISYVDEAGKYKLVDPKVPFKFEHVAQRLLSGRLCISIASMGILNRTIEEIRGYGRLLPMGKDKTLPLPKLPLMKDMLDSADRIRFFLSLYSNDVFNRFCKVQDIDAKLVDQIACAKILNVGFAIDMSLKLKGKIGAWALQQSGPFGGKTDLLYVFQFAEGDSGILKQKMARDLLTKTMKQPTAILGHIFYSLFGQGVKQRHSAAVLSLAWKMAGAKGSAKVDRWLGNHKLVEEVAYGHCLMTVRNSGIQLGVGPQDLAAFDQFFRIHSDTQ